jgi:CheY-like chemotaxis protein
MRPDLRPLQEGRRALPVWEEFHEARTSAAATGPLTSTLADWLPSAGWRGLAHGGWRALPFVGWEVGTRDGPDVGSLGPCDYQPMAGTVLIVDDHAPFRAVARALLQLEGFAVVGEAADALSALDAVGRLRPDVVVLDVQLPDLDGFEVARRLAQAGDPPAIVLVSSRDSFAYRRRLADSPARGFIAKGDLSGAAVAALVG